MFVSLTRRSRRTRGALVRTMSYVGLCFGMLPLVACDEKPASSSGAAPVVVSPNVSWPSSNVIDRSALDAVDDAARVAIARSPVPVLLPRDHDRASATVTADAEYYAASIRRDDVTVAIQGTRLAHRYDSVDPHPGDRRLRGLTGFVTENEGIRSASWVERGVAYSVDVECANTEDARCTGDAYVTAIVEDLAYVGGSGR